MLSKQIDDQEPVQDRHFYTASALVTKSGLIRALFRQMLGAERSRALKEQMLATGLPV